MKLLICTQTVDKNDPILGFFHGWIEEFSKHFEHICIVCLKEGEHSLPDNVTIRSLGKERGESKFKYIFQFYKHIFSLRGTYDSVFVHMNPHYILLGGLLWVFRGVPVFFWRNHARMNMMTEIAARFAQKIFYTSPFACTSKYAHAFKMPVGIDCALFTPSRNTRDASAIKKILFLGRLSPVKKAELCIEAGKFLPQGYEIHIYGDDPHKDQKYHRQLIEKSGSNIFFHPSVINRETPFVYQSHDIYVNLTPEGSMDKTVLEAVACGIPVIVTNTSFVDVVPTSSILTEPSAERLAEKIVEILNQVGTEQALNIENSRNVVLANHSLTKLAQMLYSHMQLNLK